MSNIILFANRASDVNELIGTPVYHSDMANNRKGYICAIENEMIVTVWNGDDISKISMQYLNGYARFIDAAMKIGMNKISVTEAQSMLCDATLIQMELMAEKKRIKEEKEQLITKWNEQIKLIIPDDAMAVIIAEKIVRTREDYDDYVKCEVKETIILAWSKHKKDLFSEMKKAAKNSDKTSFLAETGIENREKYSMGKGFYLSETEFGDGWTVRKQIFWNGRKEVPFGEIADGLQKNTDELKPKQKIKEKKLELKEGEVFLIQQATSKAFNVIGTQSLQ